MQSYSLNDYSAPTRAVNEVKWSDSGAYLAYASVDKAVKISSLNTSTGELKVVHNIALKELATSICWNPTDHNRFCIVGDDKQIEIWDIRASRATAKIASLGTNLFASWSPDGKYIATSNTNDTLAVFDAAATKLLKKVSFKYEINEFAWSANSDHILIATGPVGGGLDMGNIDIVSFRSEDLSYLEAIPAHTSNCSCLKIDNSFTKLALGSTDYLVSIWDLEEMICTSTVSCLETVVRSLSFSGNGQLLAVAGESSCLYICDTTTGAVLHGIDCKGLDADRKLSSGSDGQDEGFPFPQSMNRGCKTAYLKLLSFQSEQKSSEVGTGPPGTEEVKLLIIMGDLPCFCFFLFLNFDYWGKDNSKHNHVAKIEVNQPAVTHTANQMAGAYYITIHFRDTNDHTFGIFNSGCHLFYCRPFSYDCYSHSN